MHSASHILSSQIVEGLLKKLGTHLSQKLLEKLKELVLDTIRRVLDKRTKKILEEYQRKHPVSNPKTAELRDKLCAKVCEHMINKLMDKLDSILSFGFTLVSSGGDLDVNTLAENAANCDPSSCFSLRLPLDLGSMSFEDYMVTVGLENPEDGVAQLGKRLDRYVTAETVHMRELLSGSFQLTEENVAQLTDFLKEKDAEHKEFMTGTESSSYMGLSGDSTREHSVHASRKELSGLLEEKIAETDLSPERRRRLQLCLDTALSTAHQRIRVSYYSMSFSLRVITSQKK